MPHPYWIKVLAPLGEEYEETEKILTSLRIHTVCRESFCPNQRECWDKRTVTFLIGGKVCTRGCRYCAISKSSKPPPLDPEEPDRIARAVEILSARYVVLTSVDRDDLEDGGSNHWVSVLRKVKERNPETKVETLIPDFKGNPHLLDKIVSEKPDVFSHNIETVPRLFRSVRGGGNFERSLFVLSYGKKRNMITKSGFMVGLGEQWEEIVQLLFTLRNAGVEIVTIGQYLSPTRKHHPVIRYYTPEEFFLLQRIGEKMGFSSVVAGPLVRSSYHAHSAFLSIQSAVENPSPNKESGK